MKTTRISTAALIVITTLFAACVKSEDGSGSYSSDEERNASLKITIAGENSSTRGTSSTVLTNENKVVDYTVVVANALNNEIQSITTFTSGLTNTVKNLTSGPKKVFVVTNASSAGILNGVSVGDNFSALDNVRFDLETQEPLNSETNGLVMSGMIDITLQAGHNEMADPLVVRRVVAKIQVGTLTFAPEPGQEGDFTFDGVAIMNARGEASIGADQIVTSDVFYNGILAQSGDTKGFLYEALSNSNLAGRFFYVFPNGGDSDSTTTLLTIEATYKGFKSYYPIRINDDSGVAGSTSDNTFIKRNTIYTVSVTVRRPANGTVEPDDVVHPADLETVVVTADWEGPIEQVIEW